MDIHNYLIVGWYVIGLISFIPSAIRGWDKVRLYNLIMNPLVYLGLTVGIFTWGDPSSWQAITMMIWWAYGLACTFAYADGRKMEVGSGTAFFVVILNLAAIALGASIPSG